jgi:hypothetical protein
VAKDAQRQLPPAKSWLILYTIKGEFRDAFLPDFQLDRDARYFVAGQAELMMDKASNEMAKALKACFATILGGHR